MAYPFTPPEFLQGQTADVIHRRMMNALPDDIDKSELNIPWDFTRPAALEKAEYIQFELIETIKLIFPHWTYGQWLDLHAELVGLKRRSANKATGSVTVIGSAGLVIPAGFQFATTANLTPSVIFEALEETVIGNGEIVIYDTAVPTPEAVIRLTLNRPNVKKLMITLGPADENPNVWELLLLDGTEVLERFAFDAPSGEGHVNALMEALEAAPSAYFSALKLADSAQTLEAADQAPMGTMVNIQALEGGRIGNVPPDAVILMAKPITGIAYITNHEAITGGSPEESDDELRERVLEAIRYGISWTGCDADYVRWAKEVPGVGQAVTDAEWDDPEMPEQFHFTDYYGRRRCAGAVRLFVIDANGVPANEQILDAVYDYIIHDKNRIERKAPIGAKLTVASPAPLVVNVLAKVYLEDGENLETVTERYKENLNKYWLEASSENDLYSIYTGIAQNFVKYVYVGAALAETAGIADYEHETLTVNGAAENIEIAVGLYPVTGEVVLYE
jgi:uncharacterized phage protein gp47/JayE